MLDQLTTREPSTVAAEPTADEIRLGTLYRTMGLSDSEYSSIVEQLGRHPNWLEVGIFSVMWSEHCSYKSSKPVLRRFPTKGDHVIQGPGENAGVVDIGDGLACVFKIESHNHPTAIEPFQGAATGVGGIIRDVMTMGARPIALLNSLRFGEIGPGGSDRTRHLFTEAVAGIAAYGNCMGIPTVGGEVVFDGIYRHNPLVNAMCVGVVEHDGIALGTADGVGNPVMCVGAKTGRDGIHGATFASDNDPAQKERSAVQVGDPFMGKLLMEATLELISSGSVVGIQDMGAAGLTSSATEMASRSGSGIDLDVAEIPRRETSMTPYEIMLSESQERMLVVMRNGHEHVAHRILERWGLEATTVGTVTDTGRLRILEGSDVVGDIPIHALIEGLPPVTRPSTTPQYLAQTSSFQTTSIPVPEDINAVLLKLLGVPTIASKEFVYRQYDHMVQTATVVRPGSDAAVVALDNSERLLAMTTDGNGRYVHLDPRRGGAYAVCEAARNLVCSGAKPLAMTNCLNFSSPENPEVYWQFEQACAGMTDACEVLSVPVVSGNVSLYNQSNGVDIYPTPVVGMVGVIENIEHVTQSAFAGTASGETRNRIFVLGSGCAGDINGSEYLRSVHGMVAGTAPGLDLEDERTLQISLLSAIQRGLVVSAHDVADGGLAVCLAEAAISSTSHCGADIELSSNRRIDELLFGEGYSRVVVEVSAKNEYEFEALCHDHGIRAQRIGLVGGDSLTVSVNGEPTIDLLVDEISQQWKGAIACCL